MTHYEVRLERDLGRIHDMVESLGQRVETALDNAVRSVLSGNTALAYETVLGDETINRLVREIDRQCHGFIALHLPSAGHLRRISATMRTNLQLERIGDYAVVIAREGVQLSAPPDGPVARGLEMLATDAIRTLHQAITAFNEDNGEVARATRHLADNAEDTMDQVYNDLLQSDTRPDLRDLVALFAIYNMVKRLWDQAKNICEETVFSAYGETKPVKVRKVLFVDQDNAGLSQMAEAIAHRNHPEQMSYASAGRSPAGELNAAMVTFMAEHGLDVRAAKLTALDPEPRKLAEYFVIVSLEGPVESYCPTVPFHTCAFAWDVGAIPNGLGEEDARRRYEELYREIALNISDLVDRLRGEAT